MNQSFRYLFFLLFLFLFGCDNRNKTSLVEAANNDSIAKYLKLAGNDSLSFEERDKWNEKAFGLVLKAENTPKRRQFTYDIITNYIQLDKYRKWERYKKASNFLLINSFSVNDRLNIARSYRSLGNYYYKINTLDSSYYYYLKSEKIYKDLNDYEGYSTILYKKGVVQFNIDDCLGADLSLSNAYMISKKRNDQRKIYGILNQMGLVANQLNEYTKAIDYFNSALKVVRENKLQSKEHEEEICLSNIGLVYQNIEEYTKANLCFEKSLLNKNIRHDNPILYANIIDNLGMCRLQLGNNKNLPQLFYEALKIRDSLKSTSVITSYINLSEFYKEKDILKSISYSEKALYVAKESKMPFDYLTALSNAGSVNKTKASKYIKEFDIISDSLKIIERKTRNQFYKIQLETDEIVQDKEKAIKQKWLFLSVISGALLIVILLFVIYLQRTKQKEMQLLQIQQKANEEIYQLMLNQQTKVEEARQKEKKRIALELHDGVMNKLASTRLNLFILSKKTDQETINNCLSYIEDIHQIETEIRNVSHNLNQDVFTDEYNFITLLNQFVLEQNSHSEGKYELQIDEDINWESVSNLTKLHIYRIIQEATYNSNKYARASKVIISLTLDKNHLCLSISDNGVGFNPDKVKGGIGLKNIQERIQELKGFFHIKSKENKGTTLNLKIPLKKDS